MDDLKIEVDLSVWKSLARMYPVEARKSGAQLLNDMAFAFKELAPRVIAELKTIRNKSFVASSIRVEKAQPSGNINNMRAIAGSIERERFSGWAEDYGKPKSRRAHRSLGINARGGSMTAVSKPRARLKGTIIDIDSISSMPTEGSRIQAAIALAAKTQGIGGRILVRKDGVLHPGLYGFKSLDGHTDGKRSRAKITRLQGFGQDIAQKKDDWVGATLNRLTPWYPPEFIFSHYIVPVFTRSGKK